MTGKLKRAKITVLEGSRAGTTVEVFFNPTEYSLEVGNSFQESALPGLDNPVVHFINGESNSLSMDLVVDTWTETRGGRNAGDITRQIADLLKIDGELHAPPPVRFEWGWLEFKAVVEKLSQRFTMFRDDGIPVRATLSVTFKQYRPLSEQLEDPRRSSVDKTKRRVLTADDSIWLIAAREYRDPRHWRTIARRSRVENPRLLAPGTVLLLPPVTEEDRLEARDGP